MMCLHGPASPIRRQKAKYYVESAILHYLIMVFAVHRLAATCENVPRHYENMPI